MSQKNSLSLNWNKANEVFPLQNSLENNLLKLQQAQTNLLTKKGESSEYSDWIPFMKESAFKAMEQQKPLVDKVTNHSNAIVVIGIGGSLLGTKAVYEALTHSFAMVNPGKFHNHPLLFWAGHHLAEDELIELCQALDLYSPSLVVISKSGGTTEPAMAFRVLTQYLKNRFGQEESQKRIFAITDPSNGTLLSIAKENSYPTLPIPKGVGGRYSVFTSVGLFPLALAGINVTEFIQGGIDAFEIVTHKNNTSFQNNSALCYAGIRNILYENNYKVEALCTWSPKIRALAEWWKQLFGESDGKNGTGLFPASAHFTTDLHSMGQYFQQGERHMFSTHLQFHENNKILIPHSTLQDNFEFLADKSLSYVQEKAQEGTFAAHSEGKVPTLIWEIPQLNAYWLGNWMFTNMFACAVGGYARGIDPFNQPGVENYKNNMFSLMRKPGFERKNNG